jgi:hypothetical protein
MSSYINVGSYESMCDKRFDGKRLTSENALVYCNTEQTLDFFKLCRNKKAKYILVSACSDFGIHYQAESHPNKDLVKMVNRVVWRDVESVTDKYVSLKISSVVEDNCKSSDIYSVKVDSITNHTFTEIPENIVRWYSTNVNITHPKVVMLPFGVNDQGEGFKIVPNYRKPMVDKIDKIYVNFQDYTTERIYLKEYFKNKDFVTFRKDKVHVSEFYEELSKHKFILCPFGNGLDCYRIYETLIVGSIPIIQESVFARNLSKLGFPCIIIDNFFKIDEVAANQLFKICEEKNFVFNEPMLTKMTEEFWREEFIKAKAELL